MSSSRDTDTDPKSRKLETTHDIAITSAANRYLERSLHDSDTKIEKYGKQELTLLNRRRLLFILQAIFLVLMLITGIAGVILVLANSVPSAAISGGISFFNAGCVTAARILDRAQRNDLADVRQIMEKEEQVRRQTLQTLAKDPMIASKKALAEIVRSELRTAPNKRGRPKLTKSKAQGQLEPGPEVTS